MKFTLISKTARSAFKFVLFILPAFAFFFPWNLQPDILYKAFLGSDRTALAAWMTSGVIDPIMAVQPYGIVENPKICFPLGREHTGMGSDPVPTPLKSEICDGKYKYLAGEIISLSAAPDPGWQVTSWEGTSTDSSTSVTNTLTMPASNHRVIVNYQEILPVCYALTRSHTGIGADPAPTPAKSERCTDDYTYISGEIVGLIAVPSSGWHVSSWSGTDDDGSTLESNSLTMPASDSAVSVVYAEDPPTCYSLIRSIAGSGSIPVPTPAKSAGCTDSYTYISGESINLIAVPDLGWQVFGWTGTDNNSTTSASNSLTMPASSHNILVVYTEILEPPRNIFLPIVITFLQ